MAALLEGGLDLGLLAACFVAIALISLFAYLWARLSSVIDINIPVINVRPFHGVLEDINTAVQNGCSDAVDALGKAADDFEQGLLASLALLVGIPAVIGLGLYKALTYLWGTALKAFVGSVVDPLRTDLAKAGTEIADLTRTAAHDLAEAKDYADAQVSAAAVAFQALAETLARNAETAAERFASDAVDKLQTAEAAALAGAVTAFDAGLRAAQQATAELATKVAAEITAAETQAEREAAAAGQAALTGATAALAASEATAARALAGVKSIAVTAEDDIGSIVGKIGIPGTAALIAAIPAIATFVASLATDAGLGNQACRQKVGNICSVDAKAWEGLLAGLVSVGLVFSLQDVVDAADGLMSAVTPLLAQAA